MVDFYLSSKRKIKICVIKNRIRSLKKDKVEKEFVNVVCTDLNKKGEKQLISE
jgi:hypothetical protein